MYFSEELPWIVYISSFISSGLLSKVIVNITVSPFWLFVCIAEWKRNMWKVWDTAVLNYSLIIIINNEKYPEDPNAWQTTLVTLYDVNR